MKLAFILGTRPELLKLIPVIKALERRCPGLLVIFDTQQQRELTSGLLKDYELGHIPRVQIDTRRSSLTCQLGSQLVHLDELIVNFTGVVVQGDTISSVSGALAGFYHNLPVVHIEAGLRSHDDSQPFPEEMNRRLISNIASLHLAPSPREKHHLIASGLDEASIHVVGNPLADLCREVRPGRQPSWNVLITMHRRENRASGIRELCKALDRLASQNPACSFCVVQHSHPDVHRKFLHYLPTNINLEYIAAMPHRAFLNVLFACDLVMTDSGGVQEEAAMFGVPTMILREVLDREDGIAAGTAKVVGIHRQNIINVAHQILKGRKQFKRTLMIPNGHPSELITDKILDHFLLGQESVA